MKEGLDQEGEKAKRRGKWVFIEKGKIASAKALVGRKGVGTVTRTTDNMV